MPWQGTRCPLASGWQERLTTKVLLAGNYRPLRATGTWTSLLRRNAADITSFNLMKVLARQHSLRKSWIPAAGLGSTAGAVLAILQRKPMLPHVAGTAVSAAICLGLFGGTTIPPLHFKSTLSLLKSLTLPAVPLPGCTQVPLHLSSTPCLPLSPMLPVCPFPGYMPVSNALVRLATGPCKHQKPMLIILTASTGLSAQQRSRCVIYSS